MGATVTVLANGFTAPAGKTFDGWNTKADGTGTDYAAEDTFQITGDVTLYAQWIDSSTPVETYTLTYNANGGNGAPADETGLAPGTHTEHREAHPRRREWKDGCVYRVDRREGPHDPCQELHNL